jgi:hypothetical protein
MAADQPVTEAFCTSCGCSWFELVGEDVGARGLGGVRLNGKGKITALSGEYCCYECGEPARFPQISTIPEGIDAAMVEDLSLVLPPLVTVGVESEMESRSVPAGANNHQTIDPSRAAPD